MAETRAAFIRLTSKTPALQAACIRCLLPDNYSLRFDGKPKHSPRAGDIGFVISGSDGLGRSLTSVVIGLNAHLMEATEILLADAGSSDLVA